VAQRVEMVLPNPLGAETTTCLPRWSATEHRVMNVSWLGRKAW
jgi:hypothetical protein